MDESVIHEDAARIQAVSVMAWSGAAATAGVLDKQPCAPAGTLELNVSAGIGFTQAPKRVSCALETANALSFIDHGVCPFRSLLVRVIDTKDRSFATSFGQRSPRHIERAPVIRYYDGNFSFDPVDDVEGHHSLHWLTVVRRTRSPGAGGRCSVG